MGTLLLKLTATAVMALAIIGCTTNTPYSGNAARYDELQKQYGGGPHDIYASPVTGPIARPR